ncbi:MAG TPA: 50S ribosomal protein L25 [Candidatus Binatia bacterium]|jgi:large subunit ribosomal protein L25|nr:50S ribosomal protein L25 [Candidatus Binatia bacterium]
METVEITVARREGVGKEKAKKLRRAGTVPGVIYGPKRKATTVGVRADEFEAKLTHLEGSHLIRVRADGDAELNDRMVLVREIQRHPVSGEVLHADFYEVDLTERLVVSVPLRFVGKAEGVVAGGILQPVMREVEVECLPTEIPEVFEVDVTRLGIHDAIHLAELTLPEGVTLVGDGSQTLVTVLPPTVEEKKPEVAAEAVPAEGAPAAEGAAAPAAEAAPAAGARPAPGGGKKGGGEGS